MPTTRQYPRCAAMSGREPAGRSRFGESSEAVSAAANSEALTLRVAWTRRRRPSAQGSERSTAHCARSFARQPAAARGDDEQPSSRPSERRRQQQQQRRRVDGEHRPPAVALEVEPLVVALGERRSRARRVRPGRCRRPSPPSRSRSDEVEVLAVHEVARGSKPPVGVPGLAPDDQRRAGRERDLARVDRRRGDGRAALARPADAEPVRDAAAPC